MNETLFVEAARNMAARVLASAERTDPRLEYAFRLATARTPEAAELDVLRERVVRLREDFAANRDDAEALLSVGDSGVDGDVDPIEHAAFTVVCSLLLNLDESLSKP